MHKAVKEHKEQVVGLQHQVHVLKTTLSKMRIQETASAPPIRQTCPTRPSPPRQTSIGQPPPLPNGPQCRRAKAFRPALRPKGKIDIQLIGDSIATNLVGPRVEAATGSLLRKTKAYAAQEDEMARFPDKVVSKVIRKMRKPVHTVVLGAPSVDITNQKKAGLAVTHEENAAISIASSHAQIENAEFILKAGLAQQVLVLEHLPRHDDKAKAEQASLANKTLHSARDQSQFAESIFVGAHTGLNVDLDKRGELFTNDGTNQHSRHVRLGANDGLHMYSQKGAQAFTSSLINIGRQAGLVRKELQDSDKTKSRGWEAPRQPRGFQANQRRREQSREFQIPTRNRFENIESEFFC